MFWRRSGVVGWGKVSCILCHRVVQLSLAYNWASPAILAAGKVRRRGMFLFLLFFRFHSFSSFSHVPLFHLLYYSISLLPFSGRWNKWQGMTCRTIWRTTWLSPKKWIQDLLRKCWYRSIRCRESQSSPADWVSEWVHHLLPEACKLMERCPLQYPVVRHLTSLDPVVMVKDPEAAVWCFTKLLEILINSKIKNAESFAESIQIIAHRWYKIWKW